MKNDHSFAKLCVRNSISNVCQKEIVDFVVFANDVGIVSVLYRRDKVDRESRVRLISKKLLIRR